MVQSQEAQFFTISKLAAAGGVGIETIRFYQRKGLLETPTREAAFVATRRATSVACGL